VRTRILGIAKRYAVAVHEGRVLAINTRVQASCTLYSHAVVKRGDPPTVLSWHAGLAAAEHAQRRWSQSCHEPFLVPVRIVSMRVVVGDPA
jgi:hypothetical protein